MYGERLATNGGAVGGSGWLDSVEVVDRLDSLRIEVWDSEACDRWPEGVRGRGGGRKGG